MLNIVIKKHLSDVFKTLTVRQVSANVLVMLLKPLFDDIVFLVLLKCFVDVIHPANTKHNIFLKVGWMVYETFVEMFAQHYQNVKNVSDKYY